MPESMNATRWGVRAVDGSVRVCINGLLFDFDPRGAADLAQTIRVILGIEKPAPVAPETTGDAETGQRHEPASPIYCRAEHPFGEHNEDTHICQGFPAHPDFGLGHACRCGFKWPAHSPGDAETEDRS